MNDSSVKRNKARLVSVCSSMLFIVSALSFSGSSDSAAITKTVGVTSAAAKRPVKKATTNQAAAKKTTTKKPIVTNLSTNQTTGPTATVRRKSVVLGTVTPPTTNALAALATLPPAPTTPNTTATTNTASTSSVQPVATTTVNTSTPLSTTTSKATTTSIPSAAFDFDLQIPSPRVTVNMGSSAALLVLVLPRGVPRPVDLFFADLPNGVTATGTPNPTTGGSEVRLTAATLMVPGEYQLRVMAVAGTITKFVNYTLNVLTPGATAPAGPSSGSGAASTTTTTTTIPSGSGGFTLTVTSDGTKLKTGGVVTLTAIITPSSNFAGSATLRVIDAPENVWVGYQQNPSAGTSAIWLSSTLALKAGNYNILVEAKTSTQTSQIPIVLTIE
jgi:hypothetical protein